MVEKRRGLGRGLGALIPSNAETPAANEAVQSAPSTQRRRSGRPVDDVFFPSAPVAEETAPPEAAADDKPAKAAKDSKPKTSSKTTAPKRTPSEKSKSSKSSGGGAHSTPGTKNEASLKEPVEPDDSDRPEENARESAISPEVTQQKSSTENVVTADPDVSRETLIPVPGAKFAEVPVASIHPNRKQPRSVFDEEDMAELVHSIREVGLLQPIVIRPSRETGDREYELVMGERRWRAAQEAGLAAIPAIIRSTDDEALLRDALLENLHRSQLNPLEEAAAYQQLLDDFGCSHEELAERIGRSRPQISNTLRLMKLPPLVQRRLAAGVLSAGHARALLGLEDQSDMEKLAQKIVAEGLSVRATEELVSMQDSLRRPARANKPRAGARHERLDYLETSLADRLDTSVKITLGAKKGKVSIEFASVDDLNRIMSVLAPSDQ